MRKGQLMLVSISALAATLLVGATSALAVTEPQCNQGGNPIEVRDFSITTEHEYAYYPAGATGRAIGCGSEIFDRSGSQTFEERGSLTLINEAYLYNALGVYVTDTIGEYATIPDGSYIGSARVNSLAYFRFLGTDFAVHVPNVPVKIHSVANIQGTDCENVPNIVACYYGVGYARIFGQDVRLGHNWQSVAMDPDTGATKMTIHRFYNDTGDGTSPGGLTKLQMDLCAYAGAVGGEECGDGSEYATPVQYNGYPSQEGCPEPDYLGLYMANLVRFDGQEAPMAYSCIDPPWIEG